MLVDRHHEYLRKDIQGVVICKENKNVESAIEFKFTDYRIFPIVMRNEKICREFLELVLGKRISKVEIQQETDSEENVETQYGDSLHTEGEKTILDAPHLRGVRLDVYAVDECSWYNIEMQCQVELELPRRSRYYQGQMDVFNIRRGMKFKDLRQSYVIFLCTYDPFGRGRAVYCFQEWENTEKDLPLDDGTCKIFLNTACTDDCVPEKLLPLFRYVRNSDLSEENELVHEIHEKVVELNQVEGRSNMYTLEDFLHEREERKYKEGLAEGELEKQKSIARKMLEMQVAIEMIVEATGLSENEIRKL